jgi:DNA primase
MNLFNHIRRHIPILDIVQRYTNLKPVGHYWKGSCPFHNEKTASFTVTPSKEIFYCFGCQAKGDVIAFVALIENCSQFDAAKMLAEEKNINIESFIKENTDASESISYDAKKRFFELMRFTSAFFSYQLQNNSEAKQYLNQRNVSIGSIKTFELGYFPKLSSCITQLKTALTKHSFTLKELIDANILAENNHGIYSPFEDRIIFPIHDHLGRIVGFGGRVFKQNDERPKYYNSKEHEYFNKGSLLYGYNIAKKTINQLEKVIVVEGYMDCIALVQNGFLNTVATLGTALTLEHLHILARSCNTVYVIYDGDNAGQKAMLRLSQLCWEADLEMKCVILPPTEDPASYINKGGNIQAAIQLSIDIFSFFIKNTATSYHKKTLKEKLQATRKLIELIANISDGLKRDILVQQAAQELSLQSKTIYDEINKIKTTSKATQPLEKLNSTEPEKLSQIEKKLLQCVSKNPENVTRIPHELVIELSDPLQQLFLEIKKYTKTDDFLSVHDIMIKSADLYTSNFFEALSHDLHEQETIEFLVKQALKTYWKAISSRIREKILTAQEQGDLANVESLLKQLEMLKSCLINQGGTHG